MSEISDKFLVDEIQDLRRENSSLKRQIDNRFQKINMSLEAGYLDAENKKAFITFKLNDVSLFSCFYYVEMENNTPTFKNKLYNDFHDVLVFITSIKADWAAYLYEKLFKPYQSFDVKEGK